MKIYQTTNIVEAMLALPFLSSVDKYYPNINDWYINKVVPGIATSNDILIIAKEQNKIVGIALAKSGNETKLRCIRVHEDYKGSGLGIRLIDKALNFIGDKPHVTVAQELLHDYSRIFVRRYGFILSDVVKGIYRHNKLEYYFN